MEPAPIGRRVAAVDRPRVIKTVVAHRDELRVEVGNLTIGIGNDRGVGRVCLARGNGKVRSQILGLGSEPALFECRYGSPHQRLRDPFAVARCDNRSVM